MPRRGVKWVLACDVSIFYPLNSNVKHIHARTSDRNISNLQPTYLCVMSLPMDFQPNNS